MSIDKTNPIHAYDPRSFGCPWDGIHDDTPGWVAMMNAIAETQYAMVVLPPGLGYFAGSAGGGSNGSVFNQTKVPIKRHVHIVGNGGGSSLSLAGTNLKNSGFKLA